jgi:hypothetical protein
MSHQCDVHVVSAQHDCQQPEDQEDHTLRLPTEIHDEERRRPPRPICTGGRNSQPGLNSEGWQLLTGLPAGG